MGAWSFIDPYLEWVLAHIDAKHQRVRYTGRPASASPATGLMSKHLGAARRLPRRRARRIEPLTNGKRTGRQTMATEIRVPTLGESVTEATIGKWFKKVGDAIAADEPMVELETDKVTVEVPAPAAGTLSRDRRQGGRHGRGRRAARPDSAAARARSRRQPRPKQAEAKPEAVEPGAAGAPTVKQAAAESRRDRRRRRCDRDAQDAAGAGRGQAARREPISRSTRSPAPASAARC